MAQAKADDMIINGYGHKNKNGVVDVSTVQRADYHFERVACNISSNESTIKDIIQAAIDFKKWNTGHSDLLDKKGFEDCGFGLAK